MAARKKAASKPEQETPKIVPSPTRAGGYSLAELTEKLSPYVDGALETLGREAANGNAQAAKTVLDFLAAAAREGGVDKGSEVLREIARIRGRDSNGSEP